MAQARTPTPNSMVILAGNQGEQSFHSCRPSSGKKRTIRRETSSSSLEILPPDDKENDRNGFSLDKKKSSRTSPDADASPSSRPSSRSSRAPPVRPDSGSSRRPTTPGTPTRQVSLQAVRRRQDRDEDYGPLEWNNVSARRSVSDSSLKVGGTTNSDSSATSKDKSDHKHKQKKDKPKIDSKDLESSDEFDTDLEENSGESGNENEEEPPRAPNELMLEFLDCIYKKEWNVAANLCKMILIYEPENAEANKFSSLIEEKLKIVAERGSDEETGDEDQSDDDDDDSDDDSDDDDDDEYLRRKRRKKKKSVPIKRSQDSSDADSEPEEEESTPSSKKDSGIGFSSSSGNNL